MTVDELIEKLREFPPGMMVREHDVDGRCLPIVDVHSGVVNGEPCVIIE